MKTTHYTLFQDGALVGSADNAHKAFEAARERAAAIGSSVTIIVSVDDKTRDVLVRPDGSTRKIWAIDQSVPFAPKVGDVYRNPGGGTYRCRWGNGTTAGMINTKSGWAFCAHGVRRYPLDGSIEWDHSTDGEFMSLEEKP